jgi:hypothetical protein
VDRHTNIESAPTDNPADIHHGYPAIRDHPQKPFPGTARALDGPDHGWQDPADRIPLSVHRHARHRIVKPEPQRAAQATTYPRSDGERKRNPPPTATTSVGRRPRGLDSARPPTRTRLISTPLDHRTSVVSTPLDHQEVGVVSTPLDHRTSGVLPTRLPSTGERPQRVTSQTMTPITTTAPTACFQ